MHRFKASFHAFLLIILGLVFALLTLELALWLTPDVWWKGWISKSPARYQLYQSHPNIGWVHVPNARVVWQGSGEYQVPVTTNSLGLRDRERRYEKDEATFRILLLGDSFADGIEVALPDIFSLKLERCLAERANRPVEVINSGTGSYSPGDELLFYLHEGVKYRPDLVLSAVFVGNDITDMERAIDDNMIQSFGGYQFYLEDGQLAKRWIEWASPETPLPFPEAMLRRYSRLYYIFQAPDSRVRRLVQEKLAGWGLTQEAGSAAQAEQDSPLPEYAADEYLIIFAKNFPDNEVIAPRIKELWALFQAVYRELDQAVSHQDRQLAVILLPRAAQVHPQMYDRFAAEFLGRYPSLDQSDWANWDLNAPNVAMHRFFSENNIPMFDLLPGFRAYAQSHPDLLYYQEDIHFNEKGHQLTADLTCDWLVSGGLVPLGLDESQ
jgi:hypothetical protein